MTVSCLRAETGESGKVVGNRFPPEMIEKARNNADKLGFNNVEFRLGDIENIPLMRAMLPMLW